ncbi:DUF4270 domain-containing protein [Flavobacterium sp.]|uniref:DUF4270 domain-containing protein n=1 Tax=Flavobacterium sp. TaxID=239 RepID=UPI00286A4C34|nr:DUF4270 domain-containing protein [Flavobacterium sp.]
MYNNSFFKQILLVATIAFFASCDKDFNEIGADLIGENNFDFNSTTYSVTAYNQEIGALQSDNLVVNPLGIYENPAFGKTIASFATQLSMDSYNPTIGANPIIDAVYLEVPYFVDPKITAITAGGNSYELDSIYLPKTPKLPAIKLSVYESGYFMRDVDPIGGFLNPQKYFTDQNTDFDNFKIGSRLNDNASVSENNEFAFSPLQHTEITTDAEGKVTTTYLAPRMRLSLNKTFFNTKIIQAAAGKLTNAEAFKEYFRGLYFKVENSGSNSGSLAMLDFKKGKITIKYKEDLSTTTGGVTTISRAEKAIILNMTGNTVSLLQNSNANPAYTSALSSADKTLGDEKLYLKGGVGSMAVISLFGAQDVRGYDSNGVATIGANGVSDELDDLRNNKWLINEANLVFHIDAASMVNATDNIYEPQRIYLFDLNNNRPIVDFYTDGSSGITTKKAKLVFDGNINLDATTKRGLTYKIRITDQIRGLVKNADSTNIKLGLVVTEDIGTIASNKWKTPLQDNTIKPNYYFQTPKASVMNPLGTILYGSKSTVPLDKRLKLEIYYTKPN